MSHNNQTDMVKNRKAIRITNGKAVSIGNDLYYMEGPSHELGGIDVGKNLEVEGGEVMQVNKDNIKVFSAQPILNGISPAEKILGGGSPNKVFDEQERYKDRNGLNDDGSIKSPSTGGRNRAKQRNRTITKDLNIMNEQYKCGGKSKKGLLGTEVPPIYDFQRRIYSDSRFKDYTRRGYYNEGVGKGGGAGTTFNTDSKKVNKIVNDTIYIPLVEDFNTAFGRARQQGDSTFVFNDKLYNTKIGNNPKNVEAGATRLQNIGVLPVVREKEYEEIIPAKTYKIKKELGGSNNNKVISVNGNVIDKLVATPRRGRFGLEDKFRNKDLEKIKRDMSFNDYTSDVDTNFRINDNNWFNKFKSIRPDDYINTIEPVGIINNNNVNDSRIVKEFSRREYNESNNVDKSNNTSNTTNSTKTTNNINPTKTTIRKTKPTTTKSAKINNNSNIRLTRFPTITQAGITIPKTNIDNIRLNNFVSQEDANVGLNKEQSNADDKIKKSRKRDLINDIIGTGANIIGSGLSYANTRRALRNMQAPIEPIYEQAQKLVTDYNINPQLSDIEEQTKQMMDVIGANTSTGRARIQRMQRAINASLNAKNQLRGQKENIETQLKNADIMNRQSVNARNIAARNAWQNNVINFRNSIREQLASNRNNLYSGINASIQDMLTRRENRRQYNNTLGIYAATHPNVNRKIFEQYGVEF